MSSMRDLFHSLSDIPGLTARVTPQAVSDFVRLAEVIRPSILFAQTVNWDPRCPPALPTNASIFLAVRVGLLVEDIHGLWDTLKREIWEAYVADSTQDIEDVEDDEDPDVDFEPPPVRTLEPRVRMHDDVARVSSLCELMFYPPVRRCSTPECTRRDLLRLKSSPKTVTVFTLSSGVCEGFAVQLYCSHCNTTYYPNYSVQADARTYYASTPDYIQVSDHVYVETRVTNLFTTLTLLSWTSASNCAQIYHQSLARLPLGLQDEAKYQLRTEHVWDGFIIHALIKDALRAQIHLVVPQRGDQKDRFEAAMAARNDRIQCGGTPEYSHFCTKCVRRFTDADGVTRYADCIVTDGIEMGRPCCGVRHCHEPLDSVHHRFCRLHRDELKRCAVEGCSAAHTAGYKTCDDHRAVEEHHNIVGKAVFTLRGRAMHSGDTIEHPPGLAVDDPSDDEVVYTAAPSADATTTGAPAIPPTPSATAAASSSAPTQPSSTVCPEKTFEGNQHVTARFGRRRTHNEQLILRPCGIILRRETFYGSETTPQVVDMLRKTFLKPGSLPRYMWYDNNCGLWKHLNATPGETLHHNIGLPVDVFHWTCKHKKNDVACSVHCNPYRFKELLDDDGKWFFNSSACEQTNVWAGGYRNILREMAAVKADFTMDEVIILRNAMLQAKLEREGCRPGYRPGLRYGNVSV